MSNKNNYPNRIINAVVFSKFLIIFLFFLFLKHESFGQDIITYKVFSIDQSTDMKKWEKISFSHCIITQDLSKFITKVYNGPSKIIYNGYDLEQPKKYSETGTIYITKHIDNFSKECTIQQVIWDGKFKGNSTFFFLYNEITYRYQTDIIEPN